GGSVRRETSEHETRVIDAIEAVSSQAGLSPAQVAIAWVRSKCAQSTASIIPIIGARTIAQFSENMAALDAALSPDQLERLDAASAIPLGFPHELLSSAMIRNIGFVGKWDQIDPPPTRIA